MGKFYTFKLDSQTDNSLNFCREKGKQFVNDFVDMNGEIDTGDITNLVINHAVSMKEISKKSYWDSLFEMYRNQDGTFKTIKHKEVYDSLSFFKK